MRHLNPFLLALLVAMAGCAKKHQANGSRDEAPPGVDGGGNSEEGSKDAGQDDGSTTNSGPESDGDSDPGAPGGGAADDGSDQLALAKVVPSETGVYHGAFADLPEVLRAGDAASAVTTFEQLVDKPLAFTIIGDNWVDGIVFPRRALQEITNHGKIPVVHVKPWSVKQRESGPDRLYDLARIIDGAFDVELQEYAKAAKAFRHPIVLDFAPEANGNWYPWSGYFLGGGQTRGYGDPALADGPERFRDAYRKLVTLFRAEGAANVTFVYHVSSSDKPQQAWNTMAAYYPGDEFVDWLAVSVYSTQLPGDFWEEFTDVMDHAYGELAAVSATKPIAVLEYGIIEDPFTALRKADWISNALGAVKAGRYPRVKAMAYWHESSWIPSGDNDMRVDSSVSSLRAYKDEIADPFFLSAINLQNQ
jgi:hypothetical protein